MYNFSEPTILPVFKFLGMPVYPYALFMTLGAALALVLALLRARRTGFSANAVLLYAVLAIPLGVVLGRAVFCLCRLVDVMDFGFGYIFRIDYGGFSIMGVVAGVALAGFITKLITGERFLDVMDTVLPGLLILLAVARFAEGSTMNGTGPEITNEALQFAPLARQGLYGEYTYAVHMAEGLTALIAGVYTQSMGKRARGLVSGTGAIIACAGQIVWESARRDEVLTISFVRYVMVFAALILLLVLIFSFRRIDWPVAGKALIVAGFMLGVVLCGLMEFFIDGKFLQNVPIWLCYLIDSLCAFGMGWLCLRSLRAACEE